MGDHPNIVVMPYMEGTILDHLETFSQISKQTKRVVNVLDLWDGIADGLDLLHKPDANGVFVFHRDIKPQNILLSVDKETGDFHAKIGDFGISAIGTKKGDKIEWQMRAGITAAHGTAGYFQYHRAAYHFDIREDVFAYGMVLAAMLTGKEVSSLEDSVTIKMFIPGFGYTKHPRYSLAEIDKSIPVDLALIADHAIWLPGDIRSIRELIGKAQYLRVQDIEKQTSDATSKFVDHYFRNHLLEGLRRRDIATMLYVFRSSALVEQFLRTEEIDRSTKLKILKEVEMISTPYCSADTREKYGINFGHTDKPETFKCVLCDKLIEAKQQLSERRSIWSFLPFMN